MKADRCKVSIWIAFLSGLWEQWRWNP